MSVVAFTVERIKAIAFNALSDETVPDDVLAQNYRGMNLLISRLEAESKSVADLPVVDTPPSAPERPATKPKKDAPPFSGYGAKLKKQTFERLQQARKKGVTVQQIAAKGNDLQESEIYSALNAGKIAFERWEVIAAALDDLDKETKDGE